MQTNFIQNDSPAQQAVLRQVPGLFQSEFSRKCDIVLRLYFFSALSFP